MCPTLFIPPVCTKSAKLGQTQMCIPPVCPKCLSDLIFRFQDKE